MPTAPAPDLVISRLVRAPRATVWRAWTDPALLAQWWCPQPWTTEVRAFDLRAGGAIHTFDGRGVAAGREVGEENSRIQISGHEGKRADAGGRGGNLRGGGRAAGGVPAFVGSDESARGVVDLEAR